ncbi:MAG: hypothetical protein ACW981_19655 [Candidatus Hodarchaeales archaeon]
MVINSQRFDLPDKKLLLLLIGLVVSSFLWIFLNIYFDIAVTSIVNPIRSVIQAITFIFFPVLWFVVVNEKENYLNTFKSFFGTKKGLERRNLFMGIVEGNLLYVSIF